MSGKYIFVAAIIVLIAPLGVAAQDDREGTTTGLSLPTSAAVLSSDDAQPAAGPMKIERVRSGVLVAPDFKVTRFDGRTSELLGGYGGWLSDKTFFVGAGGYWLAHGSSDRRLGYGGVVLQWLGRSDETIGYSIKGLVGGGESTLAQSVTQTVRVPDLRATDGRLVPGRPQSPPTFTTQTITSTFRTRQSFF